MKTAISIPDELSRAVDRTAKQLGISRNDFYRRAVAAYLEHLRDSVVTDALNAVHGVDSRSVVNPALDHMQRLLSAVARSTEDAAVLRSQIEGLGVRALTKIRDLLEIALDQNTPLTVYLAPPDGPVSEVRISTAEASSGVLVLSERDEGQEDLVLNDAMLVGVNLRTWVFELHDAVLEQHLLRERVGVVVVGVEPLGHRDARRIHHALVVVAGWNHLHPGAGIRRLAAQLEHALHRVAGIDDPQRKMSDPFFGTDKRIQFRGRIKINTETALEPFGDLNTQLRNTGKTPATYTVIYYLTPLTPKS